MSTEHIIKCIDHNPLTTKQAIIIQGFTANFVNHDTYQAFLEDLVRRTGNPRASDPAFILDNLSAIQSIYRHDFNALLGNNPFENYAHIESAIIDKACHNPFAMWDSQVDVIVETHLTDEAKDYLNQSLSGPMMFHDITYTERPGPTKQTWITLYRNDPYDECITEAIAAARRAIGLSYTPGRIVTMDFHIPAHAEQDVIQRLTNITGCTIHLTRPRFKREQTTIQFTGLSQPAD